MTPMLLALTLNAPAHPPRPVYYPPPRPVPVVVQAPPVVVPAPILPGEPHPHTHRPMTLQEFARCFVPTPGHHQVCVIHPVTCRPVTVCFRLPDCGCPPKVRVSRREVEFDFGRREVEIEFRRNGTVDVDYR